MAERDVHGGARGGVVSAATVEKAPPAESDREREHRLRAIVAGCEREVAEARERRNAAQYAAVELRRSGVLVSPEDALRRSLRAPGRPTGRKLLDEERQVAQAMAEARSLEAAQALLAATGALQRARAALARHELPELMARQEASAGRVRAAAERAQDAYVDLVVSLVEQQEALGAEKLAARAVIEAALSPLVDGDEREALRRRSRRELPVALDDEGRTLEWRERPEPGLWSLGGLSWHGTNDAFGQQLVDLVRGGRTRVRGVCGSERVGAIIEKALDSERT